MSGLYQSCLIYLLRPVIYQGVGVSLLCRKWEDLFIRRLNRKMGIERSTQGLRLQELTPCPKPTAPAPELRSKSAKEQHPYTPTFYRNFHERRSAPNKFLILAKQSVEGLYEERYRPATAHIDKHFDKLSEHRLSTLTSNLSINPSLRRSSHSNKHQSSDFNTRRQVFFTDKHGKERRFSEFDKVDTKEASRLESIFTGVNK